MCLRFLSILPNLGWCDRASLRVLYDRFLEHWAKAFT